jgi:rare lipoprotein A
MSFQVRFATMHSGFTLRNWSALVLAGCATVMLTSPAKVEPAPASQRVASWRTTVVPEPPASAPGRPWGTSTRAEPVRPATRKTDLVTGALGRSAPAVFPRLIGPGHALDGMASFYWQGQKTASGEAFDRGAMTAAHPTLPFNTRVRVTHVHTGRTVEVRINDRGPFKPGRVIDLSQKAAEELGIVSRGLARVRLEVVSN